jgi:hypothetical protein
VSTNVTRPEETALYLADRCVKLEAENAKLLEAMRWRKWPEEKPEAEQHCQLILANNSFPHLCCSIYPFAHWEILNATHWRPIGPLPGGE